MTKVDFCSVMSILLVASRIPETFGGPDTMPILDALGEAAMNRKVEEVGWFAECHHDMLLRVLRVMRKQHRQPDVEIVGAPLGIPVPPIELAGRIPPKQRPSKTKARNIPWAASSSSGSRSGSTRPTPTKPSSKPRAPPILASRRERSQDRPRPLLAAAAAADGERRAGG